MLNRFCKLRSLVGDFWILLDDINSINYMLINGKVVKASRLFLGNEYKLQTEKLNKFFGVATHIVIHI